MKAGRNHTKESRQTAIESISSDPQMIFQNLPGMKPENDILCGQVDNRNICISLKELRSLVRFLHNFIPSKKIEKGSSVMIMTAPGSLDIMSEVYNYTLTTHGARVVKAVQCTPEEFSRRLDSESIDAILIPMEELTCMECHAGVKSVLTDIAKIAKSRGLTVLDTINSFPLFYLLSSGEYKHLGDGEPALEVKNFEHEKNSEIFSISGRHAKAKLVAAF